MSVGDDFTRSAELPRWASLTLILGVYLTTRGYHSFDGDQAYRLPILLHGQDPSLYATDPFVRAFNVFNPHRGYLALIGAVSRVFGLAGALLSLFVVTFALTAVGVDRLARSVWPEEEGGKRVGLVAVILVLLAKAGNIGTNHLFEGTLLDRLVGYALGWTALAAIIAHPRRGLRVAAPALGLATLIHPTVGLQLSLTLAGAIVCWAIRPVATGMSRVGAVFALLCLGLALVPGVALMAEQGGALTRGRPLAEFRGLAVLIQGPQHMLPSTWRMPQWLAWGCYPILALLALGSTGARPWPAVRVRLAVLMAVNLASLFAAYVDIEGLGDLYITVFQPFRMATLARGLALVAVAGRIVALWTRGDFAGRSRAALLAVGLTGDWMLVVATAVDLGMALAERLSSSVWRLRIVNGTGLVILGCGLAFLGRHDTESGHVPLLATLGGMAAWGWLAARARPGGWTARRRRWAFAGAWAVPAAALVVPWVVAEPSRHELVSGLVDRCRFFETPTDALERLAVWCREHTPVSSRFIGPPGPKGFRLWSRRSLAFNRAGSPYHAEGLADWAARYRDHVAFSGTNEEFIAAYLSNRHDLEARYRRLTHAEKAALARRQGADYVLDDNADRGLRIDESGPLKLLATDGQYAIYQVR